MVTRIALVTTLLLALACAGGEPPPAAGPESTLLQAEDVVTVTRRPIATGPRLSGTLEPQGKAVLRAETAGSIVGLRVELGDRVQPNQILARIDNSAAGSGFASAQSGVESAQQSVTLAERELQRVRTLVSAGALSPREQEMAESQLAQARAGLAGARAQLAAQGVQVDATVVKSPIAGVVSQRDVSDGDVVSPGLPLFTVIEPSSLRLDAGVPAAAVRMLSPGTPVYFTVQGWPDRQFEGRVERVAPAVDPGSRQIPVLVSIPNEGGELLAGLFAEGRVATERREGFVVPTDAVETQGPRPWVLKVVGGKVEKAEVELGLVDDQSDTVEIVSGVAEGDVLVLANARDVEPGSAVEVRDRSAGAQPSAAGAEG
jgi:membrane fusion protein (multidrug efflux system)